MRSPVEQTGCLPGAHPPAHGEQGRVVAEPPLRRRPISPFSLCIGADGSERGFAPLGMILQEISTSRGLPSCMVAKSGQPWYRAEFRSRWYGSGNSPGRSDPGRFSDGMAADFVQRPCSSKLIRRSRSTKYTPSYRLSRISLYCPFSGPILTNKSDRKGLRCPDPVRGDYFLPAAQAARSAACGRPCATSFFEQRISLLADSRAFRVRNASGNPAA